MEVANTLAYYNTATVKAVNSFILHALRVYIDNITLVNIDLASKTRHSMM